MILLVSGATATKRRYPDVGTLIVPSAGNDPASLDLGPERWAMDNGIYSEYDDEAFFDKAAGFDATAFMEMLRAFQGRRGCLFVSAPDVVGDGAETLRRYPFWATVIRAVGFVPALVIQDGMIAAEHPWANIGAIFVGGRTGWKLGPQAATVVAYARTRGLWCHMGRVNSRRRINYAASIGCQSFDGGQFSKYPDTKIPNGLRQAEAASSPGPLFL